MPDSAASDASRTFDPQHEDMIHDLAMDYYGKRLATCSSDRAIKIFDVVDGAADDRNLCQSEIREHDGPVWQVAWAHPKFGSILASCSYDRRVCVWKENQPNAWTKIYEFTHDLSVNSVAWAPHEYGLILACASSDSTVSVHSYRENNTWDVEKIQAHNIGCNAVSWAPAIPPGALTNPQGVASSSTARRLVSGGCDNMVKVWRYNEGDNKWSLEETLDGHTDWVRDVAWAPSIGLPYTTLASCSQDNYVLIWNQDEKSGAWTKKALPKFQSVVWRLSWSIIGNILAVSAGDGKVSLWKESTDGEWKLISSVGDSSSGSQSGAPGDAPR